MLLLNIFNTVGEDSISSSFEILLYIKETEEIKSIPFEEYIKQVVYAEMPAAFEIEALKAQAIATRSYSYLKLNSGVHENANVCTDPKHCQAWRLADDSENYKKVTQAVEETKGKVATYDNKIINAVYHASSGGFTEDSINVWSGDGEKYLSSVKSIGEDKIMKDFYSNIVIDKDEFFAKLGLKKTKNINIKILRKTEAGRVNEISINNKIFSGNEIRNIFALRSTNFEIFINKDKNIEFMVKGYGHGVGLSQWGAQAMALDGKNCEEIIKYYYTGVEIVDVDFIG